MKLEIIFLFFIASETRGQESLVLNAVEKCLPNEKIANLKLILDKIDSDETFHLLLDTFLNNTDIFVSSER
jgi:hypothetical protein